MQDLRFLVILLEGLAAICGLYYYKKNPTNKKVGFFSGFLLFTYFVESIGMIPAMIYWNESLHFLKDSFWYSNFWLFNPYLIINFVVYILYFKWNISSKKTRKFIDKALLLYVIVCITNLIFSDVFFQNNSVVTYLSGSLFLLGVIFYYYFEILLSDKILNIKNEISFYISFISLLYFLTTTPIFIYFKYFTTKSPEFVELSSWVLIGMNIFMYSSYSIAFLWLANKRKPTSKNIKNAF
ncbi:hypothetical protein [Salegentibacter mishustinae]|uniref:Rhodopsin n=1 Tax=Salegentibacter mishustinae TaxID=270918 RepID=A0A0Q9ZL08_9FLAO|nr:hypothetical protein [Salegentibacter mishustinae]KRG29080.1 hypothetical protein APR42_03895 [Salegentibacter mishustinae]PNW21867.1 hypothetical protein APB85_11590 [Salegentibacter mishustinae]PZX65215.1 hypothetical protein LY54_01508 [Salegentibacter mishustinae]GGW86589.1 hypothetical protein GCM10008086_13670 [Salegentibacter mishustinae]